jgi:pSer/pThr/pTyr-binding forkhead associated (FHA) protein
MEPRPPGDQPTMKEHPPSEGLSSTQVVRVRPRPDQQIEPERVAFMHLEVVGGPMDGVTTRVTEDELLLGRGAGCDLPLRLDPLVSTKHARIVRDGASFYLEDLGSKNGTYIGERRIDGRTLIGPGTIFVLGNTCLEFMQG